MPCEEGLTYEPCGSFCPPTCGDKDPDCGKLAGKCNEGCFCPKDTYLQDGKCVPAEECQCMFNGEVKAVSTLASSLILSCVFGVLNHKTKIKISQTKIIRNLEGRFDDHAAAICNEHFHHYQ